MTEMLGYVFTYVTTILFGKSDSLREFGILALVFLFLLPCIFVSKQYTDSEGERKNN
jgi:hypothetical protein